jgi:hypothetical protein
MWPPRVLVALLLVFFVPIHAMLWDKFPAWYHLVFLASLVGFTWLGAVLLRRLIASLPQG